MRHDLLNVFGSGSLRHVVAMLWTIIVSVSVTMVSHLDQAEVFELGVWVLHSLVMGALVGVTGFLYLFFYIAIRCLLDGMLHGGIELGGYWELLAIVLLAVGVWPFGIGCVFYYSVVSSTKGEGRELQ